MSGHIHINRPSSTQYQVRARRPGHRRYVLLGEPTDSYQDALVTMAIAFSGGVYKRADVLVLADCYDPIAIAELVKR